MPIEHLPEAWRPTARRFRDWLATDKGVLLIYTVIFAGRTSTYLFQDGWLLPHVLDIKAPLVSSMQWVVVTLIVAYATISRSKKVEAAGLTVAVLMLVIWGLLFAWTGKAEFTARGVLYIGLALMGVYTVWRGKSATIRVRGGSTDGAATTGGRE